MKCEKCECYAHVFINFEFTQVVKFFSCLNYMVDYSRFSLEILISFVTYDHLGCSNCLNQVIRLTACILHFGFFFICPLQSVRFPSFDTLSGLSLCGLVQHFNTSRIIIDLKVCHFDSVYERAKSSITSTLIPKICTCVCVCVCVVIMNYTTYCVMNDLYYR